MDILGKILNISYTATDNAPAADSSDFYLILFWIGIIFLVAFLLAGIALLAFYYGKKTKRAEPPKTAILSPSAPRTVSPASGSMRQNIVVIPANEVSHLTVPYRDIRHKQQEQALPPAAEPEPSFRFSRSQSRISYIGARPSANRSSYRGQIAFLPLPADIPMPSYHRPENDEPEETAKKPESFEIKAAIQSAHDSPSGLMPTAEGRFTETFPKIKPFKTNDPGELTQ